MWFHAEKLLKTLKLWKSLILLCNLGFRPSKSLFSRLTESRFTQFFQWVWPILGGTRWFLMSRRFRICMAKGGRESARPSYGRPKLTLNSRGEKIPKTVFRKTLRPQFSDFSLEIESAIFRIYQNTADSISRLKYENCGRKVFCYTVLGFFFWLKIRVNFGRP